MLIAAIDLIYCVNNSGSFEIIEQYRPNVLISKILSTITLKAYICFKYLNFLIEMFISSSEISIIYVE